MKKLLAAACSIASALGFAAPAPQVASSIIAPNDGYIEFVNPSKSHYDGGPVCPDGTVEVDEYGGCIGTRFFGAAADPIPLKAALDRHIRPGSYEIVGFAPGGGNEVIVYYRRVVKNQAAN